MEVLRGQGIYKEIGGKDLFTIPQISLKTGQKVVQKIVCIRDEQLQDVLIENVGTSNWR